MGLAVSHGFVWLVTLSTFVRLLSYALCIASLPKIEKTIATEAGQFQLRGGLIIPGIGFLLTLWLIGYSTIDNFLIAGLIVSVGTLIFWSSTRRPSTPEQSAPRRTRPSPPPSAIEVLFLSIVGQQRSIVRARVVSQTPAHGVIIVKP